MNGSEAAVSRSEGGIQVSASSAMTENYSKAEAVTVVNEITCNFQIDNPHQSGTPGFQHRWNVHATMKCSGYNNGNVPWMYSSVDIARNNLWSLYWNPTHAYDKNNVTGTAAQECRFNQPTDQWQGRALGHVQMPPGFEPQSLDFDVESDTFAQGFACGPPPAL
ncbi:hypothetical protein EK0264_04280 [Epidermidibacterium keratini]|uniref:Uncharacterized protein n=1 Tax=Epidermidibacterium keratini TaxID=1891644 RepID=A0A7L4YKI8_9ACTN|nr:hypothetical protein [Epidermidibacterium keratini]QHB99577.1 hypothetical protein EK0264_04280 [Epidermidibacterium keratini]